MVKKDKSAVTYDYLLSVADLMVLTGRPLFALSRMYIVSDVSHAGFLTRSSANPRSVVCKPNRIIPKSCKQTCRLFLALQFLLLHLSLERAGLRV